MQEEHRQIQANRKDGEYLTWSELNKMPFTAKVSSTMIIIIFNIYIYIVLTAYKFWILLSFIQIQVISETLRRATILPWFSRKAAQDFEIDGMTPQIG